MSPDLEWRVGEDDEQHTIAKTSPSTTSRWRRLAVALSMLFGASLGILYTRIPQPPKAVVPSPAATPVPPPLLPVIDREAHALANGDKAAFMALQDQVDGGWYRAQQAAFGAWSPPPPTVPLYTVIHSGTLPDGQRWADVSQWQGHGYTFRETRFYRLREVAGKPAGKPAATPAGVLEWKRARPDPTFWSGTQWTGRTVHFDIAYPSEDNEVAWRVTQRFERVYEVLCRDLNCPQSPVRLLSIALVFSPQIDRPRLDSDTGLTITLPSPRVAGYYELNGAANDDFTSTAYQYLLPSIARIATGDYARWQTTQGGDWFVQGLVAWEVLRIKLARATPPEQTFINEPGELWPDLSQGDSTATREFYRDLLADTKLVTLGELWNRLPDQLLPAESFDTIDGEIDSLIAYIEETYQPIGAVKFLNAIGPSRSLSTAIETAFGVNYADFEQRWLEWIAR